MVIGRTETGKPLRLPLLGTHVLTCGVSGAGKGSLVWAVACALAPAIKAGRVKLYGIDPKGGMELGQAPEVFEQVVYDNGSRAVTLLEWLAQEVKRRAESYRGRRRMWTPESGDPFLLLVVDELADVIAYQTDRHFRERATRAVQAITSQGRAPGCACWGCCRTRVRRSSRSGTCSPPASRCGWMSRRRSTWCSATAFGNGVRRRMRSPRHTRCRLGQGRRTPGTGAGTGLPCHR